MSFQRVCIWVFPRNVRTECSDINQLYDGDICIQRIRVKATVIGRENVRTAAANWLSRWDNARHYLGGLASGGVCTKHAAKHIMQLS